MSDGMRDSSGPEWFTRGGGKDDAPAARAKGELGGTVGLDGDTKRDLETDGPALERRIRELVVKWRNEGQGYCANQLAALAGAGESAVAPAKEKSDVQP